jgi:hypothetical protein
MSTTTCPACAPLAAEVAELRGIFQTLLLAFDDFTKRTGTPKVSAAEARAILAPAGPSAARIYEFPGRSA